MADEILNTEGLACPLPVLKAKKSMQALQKGQTLEVLATDPGSIADFKAFCEMGGYKMLEQHEHAGKYRFLIQK